MLNVLAGIGRGVLLVIVCIAWFLCPIAWCFTGPMVVQQILGLDEDE